MPVCMTCMPCSLHPLRPCTQVYDHICLIIDTLAIGQAVVVNTGKYLRPSYCKLLVSFLLFNRNKLATPRYIVSMPWVFQAWKDILRRTCVAQNLNGKALGSHFEHQYEDIS